MYCLTNIPNSGSSTLCAVGYYCQWLPDLNGASANAPKAYALMRQSLDSNGTFLRLKNAPPNTPLTFMQLFTPTVNPAATVTQLASYIWDLRFRIDTDLNETTVPDGNAANVPTDHSSPARSYQDNGAGTVYPSYLPAFIEIRFKALSATAARRLEGNNNVSKQTWHDPDATSTANSPVYQSLIRPNLQQFVLRVPFVDATPQATIAAASPTP